VYAYYGYFSFSSDVSNVKIKIIFLSVFSGCEMWSLVLMAECKLQGTQNRVLWKFSTLLLLWRFKYTLNSSQFLVILFGT